MSEQNQIIHAYEKALHHLPGTRRKNEEYRTYIRDSIKEVFASGQDAGGQEIQELLGDPETVRNSYIQSLSPEELECGRKEHRKRRIVWTAILTPICLCLAIFAGLFIRFHFFPEITVAIARPVNQDSEAYIERPMLIGTGTIFGQSAKSVLHERVFINSVSLMEQEFTRKYPNGFHITCTVTPGKDGTAVLWTGTGKTEEGVIEDILEQYVCPYRFHVQQSDELSGEAAARARYAEEAARQTVLAME